MKDIAAKIRALLNMTTENGASENEQVIAIQKARKLMDEHNLSMDEVQLKAEGVDEFHWLDATPEQVRILRKSGLWHSIANLAEVKYWNHTASRSRTRRTFKPMFFGFSGDVMFAKWLAQSIINTVQRAADAYIKSLPKEKHNAMVKFSFAYGMARRISDRMDDEVAARNAGRAFAGKNAVMVIDKMALVDEEFANKFKFKLATARASGVRLNAAAHGAGADAGASTTWSRPVNNGGGVLSISQK